MSTFTGRVWRFGDNINTDMMMPHAARTLPEAEQRKLVFESVRPGWSSQVTQGDIIVGGKNFGTGSSRPAAKLLRQLGVTVIVAETVNGLFLRNCVNYGVLALSCAGVATAFADGDIAKIDLDEATVTNVSRGQSLAMPRLPQQLVDLASAGGIRPLLKREGYLK